MILMPLLVFILHLSQKRIFIAASLVECHCGKEISLT